MKRRVIVECYCDQFPDIKTPCCNFFKQMLNDCHVRMTYKEKQNMYGIKLVASKAVQPLFYCPWCGFKLPEPVKPVQKSNKI